LGRKNIQESLKYFKPHQIYLGIPLYGYEWEIKTNRSRIVDFSYSKKILYSNEIKEVHTSLNFGTKIVYNNNQKVLFYPDSNFRKEVINLAKNYRLKGVAYWRLGFEK
jgi:spore germination protein YaaH